LAAAAAQRAAEQGAGASSQQQQQTRRALRTAEGVRANGKFAHPHILKSVLLQIFNLRKTWCAPFAQNSEQRLLAIFSSQKVRRQIYQPGTTWHKDMILLTILRSLLCAMHTLG